MSERTVDVEGKTKLIHEVRKLSLDLRRDRYAPVLEMFSLESFSLTQLSEMSESRLRELHTEIEQSS